MKMVFKVTIFLFLLAVQYSPKVSIHIPPGKAPGVLSTITPEISSKTL